LEDSPDGDRVDLVALACAWCCSRAGGVALTTDVGLDERPTHFVVLGLVAVVVWAIHRRLRRIRCCPDRATSLAKALTGLIQTG
jgi:hypothetical protein